MKLLEAAYKTIKGKEAPYYYKYSLLTIIKKPVRKWLANVVAANCPFNNIRIAIYRLCGFKIGKHVFIGMRCYLDDMCYNSITIGDNVVISYGVYFACHGLKQSHNPIIINEEAYIGMRASVISKNRDKNKIGISIGKRAIVGACSLVNCDVNEDEIVIGIPCRVIGKRE